MQHHSGPTREAALPPSYVWGASGILCASPHLQPINPAILLWMQISTQISPIGKVGPWAFRMPEIICPGGHPQGPLLLAMTSKSAYYEICSSWASPFPSIISVVISHQSLSLMSICYGDLWKLIWFVFSLFQFFLFSWVSILVSPSKFDGYEWPIFL